MHAKRNVVVATLPLAHLSAEQVGKVFETVHRHVQALITMLFPIPPHTDPLQVRIDLTSYPLTEQQLADIQAAVQTQVEFMLTGFLRSSPAHRPDLTIPAIYVPPRASVSPEGKHL